MKYFKYSLFIILLVFVLSIFFVQYIPGKKIIIDFVFNSLPKNLYSVVSVIYNNEKSTKRLNNDYNEKFLPETQFTNLKFEKMPIDVLSVNKAGYAKNLKVKNVKTFYLDLHDNKIILKSKYGNNFFYKNISDLKDVEKKFSIIQSNLEENRILDILIKDEFLYVSSVIKKNNCEILNLKKARINFKILNFENIFNTKECVSLIQSGRIQKIKNNLNNFIYLSTAADNLKNKDESDNKPQSSDSLFGKIIQIDEKDMTHKIFSKGHRNILGLYAENNLILATENGPRGGDEINKILENKNYGFDIASYGEKYKKTGSNEDDYKNSHEDFGFEEPLFSFIPSIGISEIIKIDNKFSIKWQNNFLIASLNYGHLLRLKFNNNFTRVLFIEKIYIGERIRDLIYIPDKKMILFAMESSGSIGILEN